jgi:hypothetical protein
MKVFILGIILTTSITAKAHEVQKCESKTLPRFVCEAVPSDDGIYRLTETPITVCHGKGKIQVVSMGGGERNVYNAKLKETTKLYKYTILDIEEQQPVVMLEINKQNPEKAIFKFIGDDRHQERVCRKVK